MPKTVWIDTLYHDDIGSGAQFVQSLMTGHATSETRLAQMTLLRTILGLSVAYVVHDSGEGSQLFDIGLGVGSQEAVAASTVPDPNSVTDFPPRGWIYRARYWIFGFAADQPAVHVERIDRDVRSRRKLDNGEAYVVINNTASEGVAGSLRIAGLIRQLWLVT